MKKVLLTAACLFAASQAGATIITPVGMHFYDDLRADSGYFTGTTDTAVGINPGGPGTIDSGAAAAGTHSHATSAGPITVQNANTAAAGNFDGNTPFFGKIWNADVQWASDSAGVNAWSGYALPVTHKGSPDTTTFFDYVFTLAPGDVAVGMYFDWSTNTDIPVLSVFHPDGSGNYSAVDITWTYYDGSTGDGMQVGPFPGQWPAFDNTTVDPPPAVPEPTSMLLIGSSVIGLLGLRRKRLA